MSKRIFGHKQQPTVLTPDQIRTPNCYYHKQPITHFCVKSNFVITHKNQCLPIHKKEHISNKEIALQGIVQFQEARGDALRAFDSRKQQILTIQEKFRGKLMEYRSQLLEVIDGILDKFCEDTLVTDGNLQIISEIDSRVEEMKGGSLKELIRYYEDTYGAQHFRKLYKMYTGDYLTHFQYQLDRPRLSQIAKDGIINTALKVQGEAIPNNNIIDINIVMQKDHQFQRIEEKPSFIKQRPVRIERVEEDNQSEISSYQLLKTKKQEEGNIYTQQTSKITEIVSQTSQNTSNVSKSKSKKRKGLSLSKSHNQLPINTLQSFQQNQKQQNRLSNHLSKSNWRNFVKMQQTHPQNNPIKQQLIINEPNPVLNPRQMRQLLAKKKTQQKQKQLRQHQSSEQLTIPTSERNKK